MRINNHFCAQRAWSRPQDVGHGDLVVVVVISEGVLPQLVTSKF